MISNQDSSILKKASKFCLASIIKTQYRDGKMVFSNVTVIMNIEGMKCNISQIKLLAAFESIGYKVLKLDRIP